MKKIIITFSLFLLFSINLIAQLNHFIYIQADNKQPFYVKLNDKVYSSSATGYIILSKLVENNYNLIIGFPKNEWMEQKLNLTVQKNDLGYLLKNFEEKGWGLVDMNTFQILYANTQSVVTNPITIVKTNEIKEKPIEITKDESKPKAPEKELVKADEVKEKPKEIKKEEILPIKKLDAEVSTPAVTKLFTSKSSNSIEIVYVVRNNTTLDTVRLLIPNDEYIKQVIPETLLVKEVETKNNEALQMSVTKPIEKQIEEQPKQAVSKNPPKEVNIVKNTPKTNCTSIANEDDYKKLRKKMASAESDNEMLFRAYSVFQKQCFTTEQIKTLSFLFLNEEGKYKFFDTAYPYVADVENFSKLGTLLSDEYYIKRFNAMLKN